MYRERKKNLELCCQLLQVAGNFFFFNSVVVTVRLLLQVADFFLMMYFNDLVGWAFKILGPS